MIVSERHRYVYIGIPKAGSQSVATWLIDHFDGRVEGYHHAWQVPSAYRDFFVFTVVRDPYERCFSAWWFRCMDPARRQSPTSGWSFDRFLRSVLASQRTGRPPDPASTSASLTQMQFVDLSNARRAIHLERPEQLELLPFVPPGPPPLPRQNETSNKPHGSFFDHLGAADEQLVWEYCIEDFLRLGYPRRPLDLPAVATPS